MLDSKRTSSPVVCHITTVHFPFDVRIFHKECAALVEAGYEVHLVVPHDRDEVVDGVHIHALPQSSSRLAKIFVWPWLAYKKVLSLRPRPAICHFHDPGLLPIGMALRLKGFKVIYDVHENVAGQILSKEYIPKLLRRPVSWAYRLIEKLTTSGMGTVHVLDSIARRYRQPKAVVRNLAKLKIVPTGVPVPPKMHNRLIYVGGIVRSRGAITMIQLAEELDRRGLDFGMKLIGPIQETDLEREMRDMISQASLSSKVTLVERVPFEQAQEEVAAAGIGLCLLDPEPNYLNSLPIKVFEYMRFGLPVVASDFPCWRQYVTDTGSGIQVDVYDIGQIADTIEYLLAHPQEMQAMGKRGRQAVEEKYCWEKEAPRLVAFYDKLLGQRR